MTQVIENLPSGEYSIGKAPLCIYIIWHPKCTEAQHYAESIYHWFRAPNREIANSGMGLPIYYRFAPIEEGGTPLDIPVDEAALNILVPLVDENFVSDPTWRNYLLKYTKPPAENAQGGKCDVDIYPVALHRSAFRLPSPINTVNYLRVDHRNSPDPSAETEEQRIARRSTFIRQQLTEVCARRLLKRLTDTADEDGDAGSQVTVFLSHAKADGEDIAESLRDGIYRYGQLKAFFDESDLPIGYEFGNRLEQGVNDKTSAMLAIISDTYASRPWCRAEIGWARKPRRESEFSRRWFTQTTLIVSALESRWTRTIPELGSAPSVRWSSDSTQKILDRLMLELLLNCYHRLNAQRVNLDTVPGRHVITWVPDPISVLEIVPLLTEDEDLTEIIYPGHGLSAAESATIKRLMPELNGKQVRLRTLEEVWRWRK